MEEVSDLFYKLLLLRQPRVGPVAYQQFITDYGGAAAAVEGLRIDGDTMDSVRREIEFADSLGIKYLCDDDPEYPKNLLAIKNHPPVLSVRGDLTVFRKPAVAIVGTRHATGAGIHFIEDLAEAFAAHGHCVVSGMAIGTDTAAHVGALRAKVPAATIAVLAGGADNIWPLENEKLYRCIIESGAVISEMPVGFKPVAASFAVRNHWIAGLSEKLILGEADSKSGSIMTARFALSYGRPVWAVPSHPADRRSEGPNRLIKEGRAALCQGKEDFFPIEDGKLQVESSDNAEISLLDLIGIIPVSESVLTELAKKDIVELKKELISLELAEKIKKADGGWARTQV